MKWDKEIERWTNPEQATAAALKYARKAAEISDNADIHWFVRCLELGKQYAEAVKLLVLLKSGKDKTAGVQLDGVINNLEEHIHNNFTIEKTDILGGDPGCWMETISAIKQLAQTAIKELKE